MPFAAVTLKPGVDVESTPVALRAGYAQSNLGRFRAGFFEKIGGWVAFFAFALGGVPKALHAWQDFDDDQYLAAGTTTVLNVISAGASTVITPQTVTSNIAPTIDTTSGSPNVVINDTNIANVTTFDVIELLTPVSVGGLILSGVYPIAVILGTSDYRIIADANATANVTNGGAVPAFGTTSGSASVAVTLNDHGLVAGNTFVLPISTTVGGVTLLGNYKVVSVTSVNIFVIAASSTATSTTSASMNSGLMRIKYYIGLGPISGSGTGYSVSTYSSGFYSGTGAAPSAQTGTPITATDWTLDNWAETLLANPANGGIYEWTPGTGFQNAKLIGTAPIYNGGIFIANPYQAVVAWASTVEKDIGVDQDPLTYRISDLNDYTWWEPNTTNTNTGIASQAYENRIPRGSAIKAGLATSQNILLWTDLGVWRLSYMGLPAIWTQDEIGTNCGVVARHAVAAMGGVVYWRGEKNFYALAGGAPAVIPCTVWDVAFQNLDTDNTANCWVQTVSSFNEVWFFQPSSASADGQCDIYVKVNVLDGAWDYGSLPRSAGIDQSVLGTPVLATPTGILYQHEQGYNADGQALIPMFTTGFFYLSEAQDYVFVDQFLPDFKLTTFDASTTSAIVLVTFTVKDFPGDTPRTYGPFSMSTSTLKLDVRFRGRMFQITMTSTGLGMFWRLGACRFRIASSGRR